MPTIQKLLVPVDYSPASVEALEYAIFLAERLGASIVVLHAWELPPQVGPEVAVHSHLGVVPLSQYASDQARAAMGGLLTPYLERGVALDARLANGAPVRAITDFARDEKFDMIVMGTHGRTGLSRFVLGSVAENVVRHAPCPVLTIHAPEARLAQAAVPEAEPPRAPGEAVPSYLRPHVYSYRDAINGDAVEADRVKGPLW